MSCLKTNLNSYKNKIIQLFQDNTTKEITSYLLSSYNIHVSPLTIKHYLKEWNVTKRILTDNSPQL